MKLSIIIPAWILDEDKARMIRECVSSIRTWTAVPYELIIVDNGSEFARDFMRENSDICIANRENLGFAKALNQGFKLSTGTHVAMMNDDIVVGPNWAQELMRVADMGSVAMPAVIRQEQIKDGESKYDTISRIQQERGWYPAYSDVELFPELDGWGSLFVARRSVFQKVADKWGSVLSEEYKYTMFDDRDLWLRLCLDGIRNARSHRCWVFHVGNGTWGKIPDNEPIYMANKAIYEAKLAKYWKT